MTLTLRTALSVLRDHDLLREVITPEKWIIDTNEFSETTLDTTYTSITYDTRQVQDGSLLFCKGHFRPEYLSNLEHSGLSAYVSERDYSELTEATGIIVNNVRQAMSLLAAEFYGRPQEHIKIVGITGTKGKTTCAYYTQAILNQASSQKTALLSSVDNCLDGKTYTESELTTPESLDLFRMLRQAVDNGMEYLVMEVSSQAYKVDRVYGLSFDVAAFLNISPDHISPLEHPSFEDYLYCKRQVTYNCRHLVLGLDQPYANLIQQDAKIANVQVSSFASSDSDNSSADWKATVQRASSKVNAYTLIHEKQIIGDFTLDMDGVFNGSNAAAAIAIVSALGIEVSSAALDALAHVHIAGRMMRFESKGLVAYVDYAHNYASTAAILDYVREHYDENNPYVTVITGSAGGKAYNRRQEIVQAAETRANRLILTEEDTESSEEHTADICQEMLSYVTNPAMETSIILDRTEAITAAVDSSMSHPERFDAILVIGKGNERWMKRNGQHEAYEGDDQIINRLLSTGKQES